MRPGNMLGCAAVFMLALGCGSSTDQPCETTYRDACGTTCLADSACPSGLYCGPSGSCTADCTPSGDGCGSGAVCSPHGRCGPDPKDDFNPTGGAGGNGNGGGTGSLSGVIRDFQASHPDFEFIIDVDPGIVLPDLGADGKPVYAGQAGNPTTNGQEAFDQWYRDTPGINIPIPLTIQLTPDASGVYSYSNPAFFPIDDQGFGNEGNPHNYHFTFELHTTFTYKGGEVFTFTGDDDLFTFINGKLGIDLGGVHGAMSQTIDLDAQAAALGIQPGKPYPLDFFFAERHTSESNFRIDTTIGSLVTVPPAN